MIPGDIDLTENLDFRKVVKRNIPKLPDSWNKSSINIDNTGIITGITNNTSNSYTVSGSNYITIRSNNNTFTYDSSFSNYYTSSSYSFDYSIRDNSLSIYYNYNYDPYIITLDNSTTTYKTNVYYDADDEYDVFGNKKPRKKLIPSIPWRSKNDYDSIPNIPWYNKGLKYHYIHEEVSSSILWDYDADYNYSKQQLEDEYYRPKNLISWLKDKSHSFIRNYFNTEDNEGNLSYLTNMSWIRVKDAIID